MLSCSTPSSLQFRAARLLTVGFAGKALSDELKRLLDRGVAGVILFRRNIGSVEETARLIADIKGYASHPLYIGVDQEGGLVQRLRDGFTRFPPLRAVGLARDAQLAFRWGAAMAHELRAVGVDVNFAPVLDVDTNPKNPVIGNRAFGSNPALVARLGVALGRGLEHGGVASCGKHFPGHGDTSQDSHLHLPHLVHELHRLRAVELVPFAAWAKAGLSSIMTAHVVFDALDSDVPATMSRRAIFGILRGELGFEGVVFSDDLEMRAIVDHFGVSEAGEGAIRAGVDNLLCCHSKRRAEAVIVHITELAQRDEAFAVRVRDAQERMDAFTLRWTQPSLARAGEQESAEDVLLELAQSIRRLGPVGGQDPTEVMEELRLEAGLEAGAD